MDSEGVQEENVGNRIRVSLGLFVYSVSLTPVTFAGEGRRGQMRFGKSHSEGTRLSVSKKLPESF